MSLRKKSQRKLSQVPQLPLLKRDITVVEKPDTLEHNAQTEEIHLTMQEVLKKLQKLLSGSPEGITEAGTQKGIWKLQRAPVKKTTGTHLQ